MNRLEENFRMRLTRSHRETKVSPKKERDLEEKKSHDFGNNSASSCSPKFPWDKRPNVLPEQERQFSRKQEKDFENLSDATYYSGLK